MLWAVTSYYNPYRCPFRRANFDAFRRAMTLPLCVVEVDCGVGSGYELPDDAGALVLRIRGDVMWQKERALNVAAAALPPECTRVLFVDGDVIFDAPDLVNTVNAALDVSPIVQPFQHVVLLCRDGSVDFSWPGRVYGRTAHRTKPGFAWAFRRDFFTALGGWHDCFIMGGGDNALTRALFSYRPTTSVLEDLYLNDARREAFDAWAVQLRHCDVGYAPGNIRHLWHGSMTTREYDTRRHMLADFAPARDLAVREPGEGLRWSAQCLSSVRETVESYMLRRVVGTDAEAKIGVGESSVWHRRKGIP